MSFFWLKKIPEFTSRNTRSTEGIPVVESSGKSVSYYLEGPRARNIFKFGDTVEEVEEKPKVTTIQATLLVERDGQKAILIGKGGAMLKRIGQAARVELERLLGRQVYLQLWVKVSKEWRSDARRLRELGYGG